MNSVSLIGRLTADPETRYFESGKVVAKFSIAVNRTKDEADFFEIEAWEKTAEVVSQYCKKGSQVGISGSLVQERWKDKTTDTNRSKVLCDAVDWSCLGQNQRVKGKGKVTHHPPPSSLRAMHHSQRIQHRSRQRRAMHHNHQHHNQHRAMRHRERVE